MKNELAFFLRATNTVLRHRNILSNHLAIDPENRSYATLYRKKGICQTGGGALLHDLDQFLSEECGLAVRVSNNPSSTVMQGAGKVPEDLDRLNRFSLN